MGAYIYENGYRRTYNKSLGRRGNSKKARHIDSKLSILDIYLKSKGISWEEVGAVVGYSGKEMYEYVKFKGITEWVVNVLYILTGEDLEYMRNEWV